MENRNESQKSSQKKGHGEMKWKIKAFTYVSLWLFVKMPAQEREKFCKKQ